MKLLKNYLYKTLVRKLFIKMKNISECEFKTNEKTIITREILDKIFFNRK